MDNFYASLLNIGGLPNKEELFKNIEDVLNTEIEPLKEDNPKLYLLCKIVSILVYNGLKDRGIKSKIVRTNELYDMYEHHFVITSYMDNNGTKYVLIDPTFNQFDCSNVSELEYNLSTKSYSIVNNDDIKKYFSLINLKNDKLKKDISLDDIMLERRRK